ncbi:MAG: hypothetical protein MZW92_16590 [Comamonadaceae bacterium]|nr:hypothetical protein [Comamonadaceae bacterium]
MGRAGAAGRRARCRRWSVRDPGLLTPALAAHLRAHGVRYAWACTTVCRPSTSQLPLLRARAGRATWSAAGTCSAASVTPRRATAGRRSTACRRPTHPRAHDGARGARARWTPGTARFVTVNNKAEGSAPASVRALAEALLAG